MHLAEHTPLSPVVETSLRRLGACEDAVKWARAGSSGGPWRWTQPQSDILLLPPPGGLLMQEWGAAGARDSSVQCGFRAAAHPGSRQQGRGRRLCPPGTQQTLLSGWPWQWLWDKGTGPECRLQQGCPHVLHVSLLGRPARLWPPPPSSHRPLPALTAPSHL